MLARWNPFELTEVLFRDPLFGGLPVSQNGSPAERTLTPPADVLETEEGFVLQVDLPGHDPKAIQVKLEEDTLTVVAERRVEKGETRGQVLRAERSYGRYARTFVLPNSVDGTKAVAKYDNGVLTLTVPKREESKPRTLDIQVR